MRFLYKKIHHFLSANSRHGTHSPFVYKLADELIYNKVSTSNPPASKPIRLISEIAAFYQKELSYTKEERGQDKILVIEKAQLSAEHIDQDITDYFMIILKDPYANKKVEGHWKLLQDNPRITIAIDLFYFGILMNRKEQPKENFKLRFPYWKY